MKDVASNMTIVVIMDCLDCCAVEYSCLVRNEAPRVVAVFQVHTTHLTV